MLGGKLCVLVFDKFLVFYSHAIYIYFTGFHQVSVCFLTRLVFGHLCDYIAQTKKQHNMATPSMTLKLGGFQHGDGVFHIKALAFARPRHGLRSAMFLTAPVLSFIVPQPSELLLTKWPIMAFAPFTRLTAHLYWCGSTNL